jgi:hypothetical protein
MNYNVIREEEEEKKEGSRRERRKTYVEGTNKYNEDGQAYKN